MEDSPEVGTPKERRGRHPKGCQCGKHKALPGSQETQFIATRDGRNPEVLTKQEALDADVTLITDKPRSARAQVVEWIELKHKHPELKQKEIAELMGTSQRNLNAIISKATKAGWLKFNDPLERLEHEIIPKVMDNLSTLMSEQDRVATIETAKATVFKHYQESKGISDAPTTVLALKIEAPDPNQARVIQGVIVGKGRELEE